MRKIFFITAVSLVCAGQVSFAAEDDMNFYKQEAEVVSASLRPQSAQQTPATVYVVTQQDIKDIGAVTILDALRNVPGVDVTEYRAGQEEVNIRGLNPGAVWENQVLVLIDGRSVLDGFFDHVQWESLPITMDEIDRIEVVEGPASAVYGANAISGVINILTKTPAQIQGGQVSYTGGEHSTNQGSVLYGKKDGPVNYRINGGWRSMNQFNDPAALATESGMFNGLVGYDFSDHAGVSVQGGFNNFNTLNSIGSLGQLDNKGITSFARADGHYDDTRMRMYWNRGRTDPQSTLSTGQLDYDQFDLQADQSVDLPFKNKLTFGAGYRHNQATAQIMNSGGQVHEDLWDLFFEDKWDIAEKWMAMVSGRIDRHPFTPIQFSPRASILFTPVPEHVFRVSAGTSYRNPTLLENYFNAHQTLPLDAFGDTFDNHVIGSQTLAPEKLSSIEVSHDGYFQRVKTNVTAFYYRYEHAVNIGGPNFTDPVFFSTADSPVENSADDMHVVGATAGGEMMITSWLNIFTNYTYQYSRSNSGIAYPSTWLPRHKVNVGFTTKRGGLTTNLTMNWVNTIAQPTQITPDQTDPLYQQTVAAYFLLNGHVGYAFSGKLNGFEVGLNAFNILAHRHYEALPVQQFGGTTFNGEEGELIGQRVTGTVSYKF